MDPYSDYKPNQTKPTNPKPNQPKSPKDARDGSSTEEAVSSPGRDCTIQQLHRNWDCVDLG